MNLPSGNSIDASPGCMARRYPPAARPPPPAVHPPMGPSVRLWASWAHGPHKPQPHPLNIFHGLYWKGVHEVPSPCHQAKAFKSLFNYIIYIYVLGQLSCVCGLLCQVACAIGLGLCSLPKYCACALLCHWSDFPIVLHLGFANILR